MRERHDEKTKEKGKNEKSSKGAIKRMLPSEPQTSTIWQVVVTTVVRVKKDRYHNPPERALVLVLAGSDSGSGDVLRAVLVRM